QSEEGDAGLDEAPQHARSGLAEGEDADGLRLLPIAEPIVEEALAHRLTDEHGRVNGGDSGQEGLDRGLRVRTAGVQSRMGVLAWGRVGVGAAAQSKRTSCHSTRPSSTCCLMACCNGLRRLPADLTSTKTTPSSLNWMPSTGLPMKRKPFGSHGHSARNGANCSMVCP